MHHVTPTKRAIQKMVSKITGQLFVHSFSARKLLFRRRAPAWLTFGRPSHCPRNLINFPTLFAKPVFTGLTLNYKAEYNRFVAYKPYVWLYVYQINCPWLQLILYNPWQKDRDAEMVLKINVLHTLLFLSSRSIFNIQRRRSCHFV